MSSPARLIAASMSSARVAGLDSTPVSSRTKATHERIIGHTEYRVSSLDADLHVFRHQRSRARDRVLRRDTRGARHAPRGDERCGVGSGRRRLGHIRRRRKRELAFWIGKPFDGQPATVGNGSMAAFRARSWQEVDDFHSAALAHGGTSMARPACGRTTIQTSTQRTYAIRTATRSRRSAAGSLRGSDGWMQAREISEQGARGRRIAFVERICHAQQRIVSGPEVRTDPQHAEQRLTHLREHSSGIARRTTSRPTSRKRSRADQYAARRALQPASVDSMISPGAMVTSRSRPAADRAALSLRRRRCAARDTRRRMVVGVDRRVAGQAIERARAGDERTEQREVVADCEIRGAACCQPRADLLQIEALVAIACNEPDDGRFQTVGRENRVAARVHVDEAAHDAAQRVEIELMKRQPLAEQAVGREPRPDCAKMLYRVSEPEPLRAGWKLSATITSCCSRLARTNRRASPDMTCRRSLCASGPSARVKYDDASMTSGSSSTASTSSVGSAVADRAVTPVPSPRNSARCGAGCRRSGSPPSQIGERGCAAAFLLSIVDVQRRDIDSILDDADARQGPFGVADESAVLRNIDDRERRKPHSESRCRTDGDPLRRREPRTSR